MAGADADVTMLALTISDYSAFGSVDMDGNLSA